MDEEAERRVRRTNKIKWSRISRKRRIIKKTRMIETKGMTQQKTAK